MALGMDRRRFLGVVGSAMIAAFGVSAARADMPKPLNPPAKVTVAYVPIMKFATMYVAAGRGIFKKYGLDVHLEKVKSGTEAIAFLTQGSVDVGGIAIVTSLWNSWNRGLNIRIIAPGGLEPMHGSPTALLVRKALWDSGKVKSIGDLKGKKLAVAGGPGSGAEYLAAKALERAHLTIRDVELENVGNPDIPAALKGGSVAAAIAAPPYSTEALQGGYAKVLATDLTPGLMTVAFVGSGKFIHDRPEVARRFVLALTEAARMMQGKDYLSRQNLDAYMTYTASTEAALRKAKPAVYDPDMKIPLKGLADVERVHREDGRTDYTTPIDLKKVVDTKFVDEALADLGPAKK